MKIIVNGEEADVTATRLDEVVSELGYGDRQVATALNMNFVPIAKRGEVELCAHDRLEIVTPRQGG